MYDKETCTSSSRHQREVDSLCYFDGKHDPVHLCFGHGSGVYPWIVGKGSRQWRDLQNDFTRLQYLDRRHDWLPVWYQTYAE